MMVSKRTNEDEQAAAKLIWQLKAIATKEIENIPFDDSFFIDDTMEESSSLSEGGHRGRTVSVESVDMVINTVAPILSCIPAKAFVEETPLLLDKNARAAEKSIDHLDHHDWGPPAKKCLNFRPPIESPEEDGKQSKRKRESRVGLTTRSGIVRSTLRKKVS